MQIVNLTQHPAMPEQKAAGVFDLTDDHITETEIWYIKNLLTFSSLPDKLNILHRASTIAAIITHCQPYPDAALIDGPPWLIAPLVRELRARDIQPLFAFSVREGEKQLQPDGSVRKATIFRHKGFVPAVE